VFFNYRLIYGGDIGDKAAELDAVAEKVIGSTVVQNKSSLSPCIKRLVLLTPDSIKY
jgi:hypothetical protein